MGRSNFHRSSSTPRREGGARDRLAIRNPGEARGQIRILPAARKQPARDKVDAGSTVRINLEAYIAYV